MNDSIWQEWINNFEWILAIAKKRKWSFKEFKIQPPIEKKLVKKLENKLGISYPDDFKEVLTKYASGVYLNWQIKGEETEGQFREIFCGGGRGHLWNFSNLESLYQDYLDWLIVCFEDMEDEDMGDEFNKIWHNKIPFIDVPNGDKITFGKKTEKGNPVIYLSHEGDDFHGSKLGDNFIDFMTKWSNLGCVGTEDWQFEPFIDFENKTYDYKENVVNEWKGWLNKH